MTDDPINTALEAIEEFERQNDLNAGELGKMVDAKDLLVEVDQNHNPEHYEDLEMESVEEMDERENL